MKIILRKEYKSLLPFESDQLHNLTVITGKNGSGKTQLLHLIKDNQNPVLDIEIIPKTQSIQLGIGQIVAQIANYNKWKELVNKYLEIFNRFQNSTKALFLFLIENDISSDALQNSPAKLLFDSTIYTNLIVNSYKEINPQIKTNDLKKIENQIVSQILNTSNPELIEIIKNIALYKLKPVTEVTANDFYTTPIPDYIIDDNQLFNSKLEIVFYNYSRTRSINEIDFFRKSIYNEINNSISDFEFIEKFIPPWEQLNQVLSDHNLDFYFEEIKKNEFSQDFPLEVKLYKKSSNIKINFSELSSGERVIIGLVLKLFTSKYYGENLTFPDLMIMDEPDAALHPEMSKLLLDVLNNTFIKKYGIKVIMTTHSPSTIALTPEENIFELKNGNESSLKKISKDAALQILTSFIPTLSIDYKNHKQVFLESPTDVKYFQNLHDKHQQYKKFQSKIYFISNGYGKGNCSQVYDIVGAIRKSDNKTSFGIVDWDLNNKPGDYVYVHGFEERYSVENFILDPIYVISLLMNMENAHNMYESLDLGTTYNQFSIGEETELRLQEMVKFYFKQFEAKFPAYKYDSERCNVLYFNSKSVSVPKWYLQMQGHEIVTKLKIIFPALNKYTSEGEIQNKLSVIISKCYPFVPASTIEVIENILNS